MVGWVGRGLVASWILVLAGCAQILGIEELASATTDAGPDGFVVRGVAVGVLGPVALKLHVDDASELLLVAGEGAFAFETRLEAGASYNVTLTDSGLPCTLRNHTGEIVGRDTNIELTCTGPSLQSIVVSGIAPPIALVPNKFEYEMDLPLLQQSIAVTVYASMGEDNLAIRGTPVASGVPSAELDLTQGDTTVDIVVENAHGWRRTYRLTLQRAAQPAQHEYGKASNTGVGDWFGHSVAMSGDILAIGALHEDSGATGVNGNQNDNSAADSGAVYVFRRTGGGWLQEAYLKASNAGAGDLFGHRVAVSGDTLVVGAYAEDSGARGADGDQGDDSAVDSGAVYVFRQTEAGWGQEAYLKASNTDAGDRFGYSVAVSGDTLVVGAIWEDSGASGVGGNQDDNSAVDSGAVYVFRRTGTEWAQEAYVKASNTDANDWFGYSGTLADDTFAVGAVLEASGGTGVDGDQDDNSVSESGAVYVFRRTGTGWAQEAYLKASNTDAGDWLGYRIELSGDALAVGAIHEDSGATGVGGDQDDNSAPEGGAVYVYRRTGIGWEQEAYVKASNTGAGDRLGYSVAMSGDILAVGAINEDSGAGGVGGDQSDNSVSDSGAVYVFRRIGTGSEWAQEAYVKASNPGTEDRFGWSVAASGDALAVGAALEASGATGVGGDQDDSSAPASGAVYIFR
ncbi:cadherin-like beta sandwich domain-containing protein [Haliangium ochraceum]|uniref:Integrin alpha beta-propellor repeat protein n=1 Tax=Haliangium ochraceum (strain DSM 14365 / JCM 11303 / SMP-2) TaxID=502025 RepID=D0LPD7_HALO1|nr:cadherin-like beta sandwich domain-containing protein [Haliangium ochraceum]ACY13502.1 Integrin alpha beta-propellor repeat protein [Haliangium ochraceum DSM 14365]